jgi:hypothetical protein
MPEVFAKFQSTITAIATHHTIMAIAEMRHWHHGTTDNHTRKLQVYRSGGRILHQVDRGKASSQHSSSGAQKIFWQNIICRFRVPRKIIVDNVKQFSCHIFMDFCHQMGVEVAFASVYHPQSNDVVEKANTLIFSAIKKILEDQPMGKWAEELPRVV